MKKKELKEIIKDLEKRIKGQMNQIVLLDDALGMLEESVTDVINDKDAFDEDNFSVDIIEEEELRFVATYKDGNIKLRYSDSEIWTSQAKGLDIGKLKDTGNNIKIEINGKKMKLQYDEFLELLTMMSLKKMHDVGLNFNQKFAY
jgi:hypothetical protein